MAIEWNIRRDIRGGSSPRSADALIADLAALQHGLVTRPQIVALGVGHDAIDRRIATRRLHPIHRGVFAVGHRLRTPEATWMAGVLAAGADTVLAFRSAGALWGMRDSARVEVISPRKLRRPGSTPIASPFRRTRSPSSAASRSPRRRARSSTSHPS
jgi:hypothetical protein